MPKDNLTIQNDEHYKVGNAKRVLSIDGFTIPPFDYIAVTYPLTTREVYTYKTGGSGGATVATVTVNYTDATKSTLLNVSKA